MLSLSLVPSHQIALWLLRGINDVLSPLGLKDNTVAQEIVYVAVILLIALLAGSLLRRLILFMTRKLPVFHTHSWGRTMLEMHTLQSCSHVISPIVFLAFIPFAFDFGPDSKLLTWLYRLCIVYLLVTIAIALNAVLQLWWSLFVNSRNTRNIPLKGILNVCRGIVWIIIAIIAASVLLDKSPTALLAGLGAFSAALLLIFRDSILGFVAGLQLSNNDMVRVGDWIVVPGTDANGSVMDVTLTAVKVRNWDNTIAMLPPHTLVSTSFVNYRGMFDLGARRFVRPIYVDPCSVVATTPEFLRSLAQKYPLMKAQVETALSGNGESLDAAPLQSGMATNLGAFRAYAFAYLKAHPKVAQDQTILVRLMEEVEFGIPVQIYCFTNTTQWIPYEQIHNQIMEHFFVAASDFGLSLCNYSNYINSVTITNPATDKQPQQAVAQQSAGGDEKNQPAGAGHEE